jgi:hypothetical protein
LEELVEFRLRFAERANPGWQQPEGLADDFTGRVVAAGLDLAGDEAVQFRGERNIHGDFASCF